MRDPWRAFVEWLLPWFDPARERVRDARTEAIRRRSISERIRAERAIGQYDQAERRRHAR
jgi:hypothetical protein